MFHGGEAGTPSTIAQVRDVFTHLEFYAGWPNAGTAAMIAKQVFKERKE